MFLQSFAFFLNLLNVGAIGITSKQIICVDYTVWNRNSFLEKLQLTEASIRLINQNLIYAHTDFHKFEVCNLKMENSSHFFDTQVTQEDLNARIRLKVQISCQIPIILHERQARTELEQHTIIQVNQVHLVWVHLISIELHLLLNVELRIFTIYLALVHVNSRQDCRFIHSHDDLFSKADHFSDVTEHFEHRGYIDLGLSLLLLLIVLFFLSFVRSSISNEAQIRSGNGIFGDLNRLWVEILRHMHFLNAVLVKLVVDLLWLDAREVEIKHGLKRKQP